MWKTAICFGAMLSLPANALTCKVRSLNELTTVLKNSPQEKQYQETNLKIIERTRSKNILRGRPEVSLSFDADKSEFKNNELSVELLFNIDDLRKYKFQKDTAEAESKLKSIENKNSSIERLTDSTLLLIKIAQNTYFDKKLASLYEAVKSSENSYNRRPIRSRDDEIVLSSLRLLKDNITLKKVMLEDQIASDSALMSSYEIDGCEVDYENLSRSLSEISIDDINSLDESNSLKLQELKLKEQFVYKSADFEAKNRISNFKIGPVFSREVIQGETENRFGLAVTLDLPILDNSTNRDFTETLKMVAYLDQTKSKTMAINRHKYLRESFKKYSGILKQISSTQKAEENIMRMKKSFEMGVISPLVYLDSYRNYVDYLETSQEAQLKVFETYLKLRGAYVENTIF